MWFEIHLPLTSKGREAIRLLEEAGVVADWRTGRRNYRVELNREPFSIEKGSRLSSTL